jgi:hypothetical protein
MTANWLQSLRGRCRGPLLVMLVFALSIVCGIGDAAAYRGWCRADPQFQIDGRLVRVMVSAQVRDMRTAHELSTGPIDLVLTVPSGTDVRYVAGNDGFGYGFAVVFEYAEDLQATDHGIPVRVAVHVPMTDSEVTIRADFIPGATGNGTMDAAGRVDKGNDGGGLLNPGTATGTANEWIVFTT